MGVRIKEDIQHNEAFCSVPMKLHLDVNKAQNCPELKPIFEAHPELFTDECPDFEHNMLACFIIFEMQKGEESLWFNYFEILPRLTNFWRWDSKHLKETDDPFVLVELDRIRDFKENSSWGQMKPIFGKYPEVFKPDFVTHELFLHVETSVATRVFGYSIPCTAMIPLADMLNHADIDVQYEIFNKRLHPGDQSSGSYFTRSKYMNDFSFMYTQAELDAL